MIFYAGAPNAAFLRRTRLPMFAAMPTLADYRGPMPARPLLDDGTPAEVAIDGGVFHSMTTRGELPFTVPAYAALAQRACAEVGGVVRVAALDLMCEPPILAKTGLSIDEHQRITIANLLELRALAPGVPWMPTLQGWDRGDYLDHLEQYDREGVDLLAESLVGLGSVCRRQNTAMAEGLVRELVGAGLSLHLLGFKVEGLARFADLLGDVYETRLRPRPRGVGRVASYDTQGDNMAARRQKLLHPDCARRLRETGKGHQNCASCLPYILMRRAQRLAELDAAVRGAARPTPRDAGLARNHDAIAANAARRRAKSPQLSLTGFA